MLHERKFQSSHSELLTLCIKAIPSLKRTKHPIVLDEEKGIVNAITTNMPSATRLRCWNHLLRDVTRWLRAHDAKSTDISVYLSDLRELFHQPTQEEYRELLKNKTPNWSVPFREYFANEIAPQIDSIARWAIEPYGVYDPYSGVTNNQAESLNYVLKQLQEWHEAPVDCMVLALYNLQSHYMLEIARGQNNMGNYHLHEQFSDLYDTSPIPATTVSPDEIVERIKGKLRESTQPTLFQTSPLSASATIPLPKH